MAQRCLPGLAVLLCAALLSAGPPARAQAPADDDWTRVPGAEWTTVPPERAGFYGPRLEVLRAWLKTGDTAAMVVAVHGQVVFEYGDVRLASKVASVRKSILAMLYGPPAAAGKIDFGKKVVDLGLEEAEPFLPIERYATLEQLLMARSGIYLTSGNKELDALTPKRGSEAPGTRFQYNNWDFNAAGTAFEKLTGTSIYDALERDLARPIGMQDFDRALQQKVPSPGSVHPEYVMKLSTRDMARLGVLMSRRGRWRDQQVLPEQWCRYITTLVTPFDDIHPIGLRPRGGFDRWGYGVMWWVWESPMGPSGAVTGPLDGAYTAWGAGGQYITVLPAMDMVVAHKVDIDARGSANVSPIAYDAILAMLFESQCPGGECSPRPNVGSGPTPK